MTGTRKGGAMGVLAQWAVKVRGVAQRDESLPLMASASAMAILLMGFVLHGFLVVQKGDLVPLFERPLAEGERGRVARVLEDEAAAYILTPGNVLVSRRQKSRILARLAQPERPAADRDLFTGMLLADAAGAVAQGGERPTPVRGASVRPAAPSSPLRHATGGGGTPVPVRDGNGAWTIYNITCDDAGGNRRIDGGR